MRRRSATLVLVGALLLLSLLTASAPAVVAHDRVDSDGMQAATPLTSPPWRRKPPLTNLGAAALAYVTRWLDDDAARAVARHSNDIARGLNDIARIPDLTVGIVREKLYYFLRKECSMTGGTALQIADAVATTIEWLVF